MPGYDFLLQAMGGLMRVTGEPDGRPLKVGTAVVDLVCGLLAANGIQAALVERARTGARPPRRGVADGLRADVPAQPGHGLGGRRASTGRRRGNRHPSIVPYETYETADRPFAIAVGNDRMFARLCEALGLAELPRDARFATNAARVAHADELDGGVRGRAATQPAEHWLERAARGEGARRPDQRRRRGVRAGRRSSGWSRSRTSTACR